MAKQDMQNKINERIKQGENLKYIKEEFREKLWSTQNGDVSLEAMITFAIEYDWLLDMIINEAKNLKD